MTEPTADLLRRYGAPGPRYTSYPTVPFWDSTPSEQDWLRHLDGALVAGEGSGAALYVHIPFCHALCTFCGCNVRIARSHSLVAPYLQALLQEWRTMGERLGRDHLTLSELYLGGGTPTYLHPEELDALLAGLLARAALTRQASLTVEADPRITSRAHLEVLARHGVNRVSLGVQDFDPRVQDIVNRVQGEDQVRRITDEARELGFRSVAFDLIYGLPLQTPDGIEATMDVVMGLRPDRIAFYPYAHVPWIKPTQRRFTEADLPEGDAKRALQMAGRRRLAEAGYVEIGMDLFALPGDDLVTAMDRGTLHRNFMGYAPQPSSALIGLGVSAIGDAGTAFAQNDKNQQQYEARVGRGELPLQRGHVLDAEDRILRRHILRLMTRHETTWSAAEDRTAFLDGVAARLAPMAADGLVELAPERVVVLPAGRPFLRNVCRAFDARLARVTSPR